MAHMLIIEDEPAIRTVLAEVFKSAGHDVALAADGMEGIAAFHARPCDLVVLDLMLPKIDGFTVCELIRQESDVPVMMLTALGAESDELRGFELLADDYVTKPFSVKVVLRRAEALLRRAAHAPADGADGLLRCGDVALDPAGRTASRGGSPVDLTRTEFDVLELLLAHPGRVFTRDELLSLVWHYEFASDPKIVNIHVMNIRKKLGAGLVATVRGIGYKLGEA
ncbi:MULTISPECIES: response regulator transcription factor [Gordonibacter]|uniref:response regulator transcription factor n=1 Tax=Gordonibacter TaxID=644652 RepID=UPI000F4D1EF1|nr:MULTISPECIES: response regulator transcription factor [Gordonibacter]MDN4471244.1 response regulator transcription factor [Gordonibacter sp. RACS_AR68]ROT90635.1 DNA-binding response regulator [Gordonibacter urolithinfaciens]